MRARRTAAAAARAPQADLGPEIRRANGHLHVVEVADPDVPSRTIRRAAVQSHADYLLRRGGLEMPEWLAARRWAELRELAEGARDLPDLLASSARVAPWMRSTPAEVQLRAAAELAEAQAILGPSATRLVDLFARDGATAKSIAAMEGAADYRPTLGAIRAGLRRCAEHWGL